jgi:hypothetical protein
MIAVEMKSLLAVDSNAQVINHLESINQKVADFRLHYTNQSTTVFP